jgi:hypothetical protein
MGAAVGHQRREEAMTSTIQFLNAQMEADETWKKDHRRAMQCADLVDRVKVGLSLFRLFRSTDELWSRRVQAGNEKFDPKMSRALYDVYKWWLTPCGKILAAISRFEEEGYRVDGAAELRDAYATARGILKTNMTELTSGYEQVIPARIR